MRGYVLLYKLPRINYDSRVIEYFVTFFFCSFNFESNCFSSEIYLIIRIIQSRLENPKFFASSISFVGIIRTDFSKTLYENPVNAENALRGIPLGRLGEADECAGTVSFLVGFCCS